MRTDDLGKLVLRVTLGGLMLFHGAHKLSHGVSGIAGQLAAKGLPGFIAYGAFVGEVVAPLLVIAGLATRAAAGVMAFHMVVAIWLRHAADVVRLHPRTGAWAIELQVLYLSGAVALALLGSGRYALSRGRGRLD